LYPNVSNKHPLPGFTAIPIEQGSRTPHSWPIGGQLVYQFWVHLGKMTQEITVFAIELLLLLNSSKQFWDFNHGEDRISTHLGMDFCNEEWIFD